MEGIYETIASLVKEIYGIENVEIETEITSFNAASEDHEEFFKEYQRAFQVDMSKFNYHDFFDEDQIYILAWVKSFMRIFRPPRKKKVLTIGHLMAVAANRKWSLP